MAEWTRKPQEAEGHHRFRNRLVITAAANRVVSRNELFSLCDQLWQDVETHGGLDYLQVFTADDGRVLWVIDDGQCVTWLLPSDY